MYFQESVTRKGASVILHLSAKLTGCPRSKIHERNGMFSSVFIKTKLLSTTLYEIKVYEGLRIVKHL